jgi:hypothetical protein
MRSLTAFVAAAALGGTALGRQSDVKAEALKKLTERLPALIKEADTDGSGTIKRSEFTALEGALRKAADGFLNEIDPSIAKKKADKDLKKYDTSGDGTLDDDEKKAMAEDQRLRSIRDFDWDEDGQLGEREKTAMQWAEEGRVDGVFRRANTDDKKDELSADEIGAAAGWIAKLAKKPK